jgi:hypothetical protein
MKNRIWLIAIVILLVAAVSALALGGGVEGSLLSSLRGAGAGPAVEVEEYTAPAFAAPLPDTEGEVPAQSGGPSVGGKGAAGGGTPEPAAGKAEDEAAEAEKPVENLSEEEWLEKLEEWKNQDPKEILDKKYEDLEKRKTTPWNEDDPANFVHETGRSDPLTPVMSAIPDELKLRRGEDTDPNEFVTYQFEQYANNALQIAGSAIQVYSVLQIGLQKLVTIGGGGGQPMPMSEGQGVQFDVVVEEYPVSVGVTVVSISEDEVVLSLTAQPYGSTVQVERSFVYIPQ